MNVSLTPELQKFVTEKVESGLYNSANEVIRQVLRLLVEQESEYEARVQVLRTAIQDGIQSGEPQEWSPSDFKAKARERHSSKTKS